MINVRGMNSIWKTAICRGIGQGFFRIETGTTVVKFTENVTAKKLIMKPFIGIYLKKQQSKYIQDLKNALELNE